MFSSGTIDYKTLRSYVFFSHFWVNFGGTSALRATWVCRQVLSSKIMPCLVLWKHARDFLPKVWNLLSQAHKRNRIKPRVVWSQADVRWSLNLREDPFLREGICWSLMPLKSPLQWKGRIVSLLKVDLRTAVSSSVCSKTRDEGDGTAKLERCV